jgi:DNA modification methylase
MIVVGDCRESLRAMPARSVQTCVTSPPYFGLRDYGHDGQIGLEPTPDEFVQALVQVFREVRRVLRDDGTVWLNLGDSYNNRAVNRPSSHQGGLGFESEHLGTSWRDHAANGRARMSIQDGDLKEKDLLGIPWMVAFALRADGWYLRSDIIWSKPNPMPESVTDRPTKAHEYLFLLSKGPRYFYDADAVREADQGTDHAHRNVLDGQPSLEPSNGLRSVHGGLRTVEGRNGSGRNRRSVWTVATQPFPGAHFATFPPKLIEPCILAGTSPKACGVCGAPWERVSERRIDESRPLARQNIHEPQVTQNGDGTNARGSSTWGHYLTTETKGWEPSCEHHDDTGRSVVLDPFAGSGTVGVVCGWHGRDFIGCELNEDYAQMARERIALEGRPGGKPNGHEPVRIIDGQLGLEII